VTRVDMMSRTTDDLGGSLLAMMMSVVALALTFLVKQAQKGLGDV
jgi:hypothetical protein